MIKQEHPFKPIVFKDSEILILGSFPSIDSFDKAFYYAHPRNQFWKILSDIIGYPINNRDQKIWLLKESKIALWDMVANCTRDNSLDSSLEDIEVNNIDSFLEEHPTIQKIAFTGRLAERLYKINFDYLERETLYLPSPSSAYAKMSLENKIIIYKEKLGL
ncbi:G:T/U mismatch-specific uracil/thymine DNA-glycosylase [hydrothermal vent metagenome]|uniref:G:T/U mismatch-specific uracil/thymine DNA-glycosylase n=1 Tax=hydrothermal vent metagenome TaxID=652676 RepID=A0A1W1CPT1_9ZZZZ